MTGVSGGREDIRQLTSMVSVFKAHVAVSKCGDVQVASDLFDFHTSVDATGRTIVDLVVGRPVLGMLLLSIALGREKGLEARE